MNIAVTAATGIPQKAYLSIRVGDTRRQLAFQDGDLSEDFHFDMKKAPKHFAVDVFQKVGSGMVSLADLKAKAGEDGVLKDSVNMVRPDGGSMNMNMKVEFNSSRLEPKAVKRDQDAGSAKTYLEGHKVQELLQTLMLELLKMRPEDPESYIVAYVEQQRQAKLRPGTAPAALVAPPAPAQSTPSAPVPAPEAEEDADWNFADHPGLGDSEWPGFPADSCPEQMPDLAKHHSIAADILRKDPSIYDQLRSKSTPLGVPFAKCVKTSFDNTGHAMIKTVGAVAGDENCYDVFSALFDPLIQVRHPDFDPASEHVTDFRAAELSSEPLDLTGTRVLSVRARLSLNFGGMRMAPAISRDERREVEKVVVLALQALTGDLRGRYLPLAGSESHAAVPGGMSAEDEDRLEEDQLLFDAPDSEVLLSSGFGRHWPDARGVFVDEARRSAVWVNEEDHLRVMTMQPGGDVKDVFTRLYALRAALDESFKAQGKSFAHSKRLGFLGSCASNLGTCMAASATLKLPLVSGQPKFRAFCKTLKLHAHLATGPGLPAGPGIWEVSNAQRLGTTEVQQVSSLIEGVRTLLDLEAKLERGEEVPAMTLCTASADAAASAPGVQGTTGEESVVAFADIPGLGPDECPGFPTNACPTDLPDLSKHYSIMADVFKQSPGLYEQLGDTKTRFGVTLAKCMKMGVDNPGHPMIKTIGACAGDAECYEVFRDFFDPIIVKKHKSYKSEAGQVTDLDHARLSREPLDPTGAHVLATSVRAYRSVTGARFACAVSRSEREEVERDVAAALLELTGELAGSYFPLRGSKSYGARPDGMSEADAARLDEAGLLFREPDAQLLLSSGVGRDWPHGRGVFAEASRSAAVHVNDEEHLRFAVERPGGDLQGAFAHFCCLEGALGVALRTRGRDFATSSRLGFLSGCPGNLGTGLSLEVRVKLPMVSELPEFKALQRDLGVRARCVSNSDGVWALQSFDRLGSSEVQQVEAFANAVRQFVSKEVSLKPAGEPMTFAEKFPKRHAANLRQRAKVGLEKGVSDGSLAGALGKDTTNPKTADKPDSANPNIADKPDGSLAGALGQDTANPKVADTPDSTNPDNADKPNASLRQRAKVGLENGVSDGSLAGALDKK